MNLVIKKLLRPTNESIETSYCIKNSLSLCYSVNVFLIILGFCLSICNRFLTVLRLCSSICYGSLIVVCEASLHQFLFI